MRNSSTLRGIDVIVATVRLEQVLGEVKMDSIIKEYQEKIRYHFKEIDDLYTKIDIIKKLTLTCEQTNKQTGTNKVLPKGWT